MEIHNLHANLGGTWRWLKGSRVITGPLAVAVSRAIPVNKSKPTGYGHDSRSRSACLKWSFLLEVQIYHPLIMGTL